MGNENNVPIVGLQQIAENVSSSVLYQDNQSRAGTKTEPEIHKEILKENPEGDTFSAICCARI